MKIKTPVTLSALLAGCFCLNALAASAAGAESMAQGDQLWAQGRLQDARQAFEQAASESGQPVPALMKLGGVLLSGQDFAAAIATYKKIIGLDGNNARAWMGLGMAYLHTQQKDLSRAAFAEAVRIEPRRKQQLAALIDTTAP